MASVRIKMVALVLPMVMAGFAVLTGVAITRMGDAQRDVAQQRAEQTAKALAGSADQLPNTALQAARSMAAASAAFRSPDRRQLQAQISAAAQLTPGVSDTWVVFEPGAAPGRDADWRGRPGMSGSGRFYTLYTRGGENATTPFPYTDDVIADLDGQDWRMVPMRTLQPVVTEPALDTGLDVILTNADVPIVRGGRFLGVAGVDIVISDLSRQLGETRVGRQGYVLLLSAKGTLLAAPDRLGVGKSVGVEPLVDVVPGDGQAATADLVSAVSAQPAGSRETRDPFSGGDALVSWSRLPSAGWTLVTVTPSSEVFAAATSLRNTLVVIAVVVALVAGAGMWLVMSRLLRPVARLREGALRIAGGRLDWGHRPAGQRPGDDRPPASADEFGQVSAAFDGMLDYLRGAAAYLRRIAAGDLSRPFPLASDADELGSALNEMHAGLSRIVGTVAGQTGNLQDAAQVLADRVDSLGEASGRVRDESAAAASGARDFANGVGDIARSVAESSRLAASARELTASMTSQLDHLSQSSTGIENLISVIDNIAEQTRLLALNATIEAARAGAAGKGFAVVAEEVKALAQETSRATDDVAERVSAIRGDVDGTVGAVRRITESIAAMAGLQDAVATATGEQSANSGEVSERMSGVAAAAAGAQRDVEANRELVRRLRETTADLHAAVAGFQI